MIVSSSREALVNVMLIESDGMSRVKVCRNSCSFNGVDVVEVMKKHGRRLIALQLLQLSHPLTDLTLIRLVKATQTSAVAVLLSFIWKFLEEQTRGDKHNTV